MVVPFCAVTTVVMVLTPTFNGNAPDVVLVFTGTPFTFIAAVASVATGVMVRLATVLATLAV